MVLLFLLKEQSALVAEVTSVSAFCTVASTQHIVIDAWAGQFANRDALITCLNTELGHSIKVFQG